MHLNILLLIFFQFLAPAQLQGTRQVTDSRVPIFAWVTGSAPVIIRYYCPENVGGLGDVVGRAQKNFEAAGEGAVLERFIEAVSSHGVDILRQGWYNVLLILPGIWSIQWRDYPHPWYAPHVRLRVLPTRAPLFRAALQHHGRKAIPVSHLLHRLQIHTHLIKTERLTTVTGPSSTPRRPMNPYSSKPYAPGSAG